MGLIDTSAKRANMLRGKFANETLLPISGSNGQQATVLSTNSIWIYNGGVWRDSAMGDVFANETLLPISGKNGQEAVVLSTNSIWIYNEGVWRDSAMGDVFANETLLPISGKNGQEAVVLSTNSIWIYNEGVWRDSAIGDVFANETLLPISASNGQQATVLSTNSIWIYNEGLWRNSSPPDEDGTGIYPYTIQGTVTGNVNELPNSIAVKSYVDTSVDTKASKVLSAVAGDIATLDASGNLVDSGTKFSIDSTLGGVSPLNTLVSSQSAVKSYVDTSVNTRAKAGIQNNQRIYVDCQNGNDTTGIGTVDNPYFTIQKALNTCVNNSIIYVGPNVGSAEATTSTITLPLGIENVSIVGSGDNVMRSKTDKFLTTIHNLVGDVENVSIKNLKISNLSCSMASVNTPSFEFENVCLGNFTIIRGNNASIYFQKVNYSNAIIVLSFAVFSGLFINIDCIGSGSNFSCILPGWSVFTTQVGVPGGVARLDFSGLVPVDEMPTIATLQGNSFNGANQLLQLDSAGLVPATNLPVSAPGTLTNLSDVIVASMQNNDVLTFNSVSSKWENKPVSIPASLTRIANDFNTFASKPNPTADDIILIEDSENFGNKAYISIGSIKFDGGVF